MSLKKNLIKNGFASAMQKIIRIAEQLLLVPFFITAWGAAYYGEWLTLTIIPSVLAFSDLGFGSSAANKFVLQYASGDKQGAANTGRSGLFLINIVVSGSILITLFALYLLNHFHVFDKFLIDTKDAIPAVFFLMIARILSFYSQLYEAYFRSARKAALSINLQTVYASLNIIAGLLVLISGKGVVAFAMANLLVAILFNPFYIWKAKKILALDQNFKGHIVRSEIKSIAANGFGYLLSPVWQAIYFQGTTLVVRLTLGPLAVAIFSTVRTISRAVNQVFNMVTLSVMPELQFEIGAGNLEKARKIFRMTFSLVLLLAIGGVIFLYFLGPWFYEIWTQKALNPPTVMWNIFILSILFHALWWPSTIIFQGFNKPYSFTIAGVIGACISIFGCYYFSKWLGLSGAALGVFLLDFLLSIYILPVSLSLIGQKKKDFLTSLYNDICMIFLKPYFGFASSINLFNREKD